MSEKIYAIITAGGTGSRMKSDIPKQYMDIGGEPMIAYALRAFEKSGVDKIIVVCATEHEDFILKVIEDNKISKFESFAGNGAERAFSVKNGLDLVPDDSKVLIHDAARPMITPELIDSCIKALKSYDALITAVPVKDTIKAVSDGVITDTPDRSTLFAAQTPQCFATGVLKEAYRRWEEDGRKLIPTDDASLVEKFSDADVHIIPGDDKNFKVTTPEDLRVAENLLCK